MIEPTKKQFLILENRECLKISGVEGIVALTETDASILVCGENLEIKGSNLTAEKLSVESGELVLSGVFDSLKYVQKKEKRNLFKRIFK